MNKIVARLSVLSLCVCSCARLPVYVQFKNNSTDTFTHLNVEVLGEKFSFDTLRAGQTTRPVAVRETYYYCYAQVFTEKDTLKHQPIDYTGEKLYKYGKLTFDLSIITGKNRKGKFVRGITITSKRGQWKRKLLGRE